MYWGKEVPNVIIDIKMGKNWFRTKMFSFLWYVIKCTTVQLCYNDDEGTATFASYNRVLAIIKFVDKNM